MKDVVDQLKELGFDANVANAADDLLVLRVARETVVEMTKALKSHGFKLFTDLTCADYGGSQRKPRYEIVIMLYSFERKGYVRLLAGVPDEDTHFPTLTSVFKGANWPEREVYDLFGIVFDGHPNLTRILMPDDYEGHPLRRDFPITGFVPPAPLARE